jgi:hypothetical protein
MAHTILLEKGDKPLFKMIYRINPKELEETKRQVQEHLERDGLNLVPRLMNLPFFLYGRRMEL